MLSDLSFNIPKQILKRAIIGNGVMKDPETINKKRDIYEPRIKRGYYYTQNRLTHSQTLTLLLLYSYCDSDGIGIDIKKRELSEATGFTIQTINTALNELQKLGFIQMGLKHYGYASYQIVNYKKHFKKNQGGYYVMSRRALTTALKTKNIHKLRVFLASLLFHDLNTFIKKKTIMAWGLIERIVPSVCHPKALKRYLKTSDNEGCEFILTDKGIEFKLEDAFYGKTTKEIEGNLALEYLRDANTITLDLTKEEKEDIISLSKEFGFDKVKKAIEPIRELIKDRMDSLGATIRILIEKDDFTLEAINI